MTTGIETKTQGYFVRTAQTEQDPYCYRRAIKITDIYKSYNFIITSRKMKVFLNHLYMHKYKSFYMVVSDCLLGFIHVNINSVTIKPS